MAGTNAVTIPMDLVLNDLISKLGMPPTRYYTIGTEAAVEVVLDSGNVKRFMSDDWYVSMEDKQYQVARWAIRWIEEKKNCQLVDFNYPELQWNKNRLDCLMKMTTMRAEIDHMFPVMARKFIDELMDESNKLMEEVQRLEILARNGPLPRND